MDFTAISSAIPSLSKVFKTKIQEKRKLSSEEYTKFTHLFEGALLDVLSLTCLFNLFLSLLCFVRLPQENYRKRESKWALLKQRIKVQLFSLLKQLFLNLTLEYNQPKNLKTTIIKKIMLMSSPLWPHLTPQIIWYYCFFNLL